MTPGVRLVICLAVDVGSALLAYLLPRRAARSAHALALLALGVSTAFLLSDAAVVYPAGRVERSLGDLVPGVPLLLRADPAGMTIALVAAGAALLALLEGARLPLERSALLLCLAGAQTAALGGNAVLLFGGMELAGVGALLMAAAAPGGPRRLARWFFVVQHGFALGLVAVAIELLNGDGTSDPANLPPGAVGWGIAIPWAMAAAARLCAGAGLAGDPGRRDSAAWASVGAAPAAFAVLLRLMDANGADGTPLEARVILFAAGLAVMLGGAVGAVRLAAVPAAAGRLLAMAAAGPVLLLAGADTQATRPALALAFVSLVLVLATAPAWGASGVERSGRAALWLRAAALAAAGGIPVGLGATVLVAGTSELSAQGLPRGLLAATFGVCGLATAGAGARAAQRALSASPSGESRRAPRPDAAVATLLTLAAAVVPGVVTAQVAGRIVDLGAAGTSTVDAGALTGPGGGWAGGYLAVAVLVAVVAGAAALAVGGAPGLAQPAPMPAAAPGAPPWRAPAAWLLPVQVPAAAVARVSAFLPRLGAALSSVDGWLGGQPGLALAVGGAAACLFIFR